MKTKIEIEYLTLRNSQWRALGAVLLIISTLLITIGNIVNHSMGYVTKDVHFYFYPGIVVVMVVGIGWLPSINASLRSPAFLVKSEEDRIAIFGQNSNFLGHVFVRYENLSEAFIVKTFFRETMFLKRTDGTILKVPMVFASLIPPNLPPTV